MGQLSAGESAGNSSALQVELASLRERCAALIRERDELAADKADWRGERDRLIALAEVSQRLLVDQRPAETERRPGWIGRLFGR